MSTSPRSPGARCRVWDAADPLALALPDHPFLRSVVMLGPSRPAGIDRKGSIELGADVDEAALINRAEGVILRDTALILHTSGTTSQPRGAMVTHEAYVRGWLGVADIWHTTSNDRQHTPLPLFHVTALGCLLWTLTVGATFFTDYTFDPQRALATLERERITEFFPAYPPVMEAVLAAPGSEEADLGALWLFQNVAPPETLEKFQSRLPYAIQLTCYGGTEGAWCR